MMTNKMTDDINVREHQTYNYKCTNCKYKKFIARIFDMHFDYRDCPLDECIMNDVPDNNVGKKTE